MWKGLKTIGIWLLDPKCYGMQDVAQLIFSGYHNPFTKPHACHYYAKIKGKSNELQEGDTQGLSDI
jgi:hypothetical protein